MSVADEGRRDVPLHVVVHHQKSKHKLKRGIEPHPKAAIQKINSYQPRNFTITNLQLRPPKTSTHRIFPDMAEEKVKLPVQVQKPTPYTFDLGLLLASDPNPLLLSTPENLEADLAATARDGAQALLNQLLGTCPISSTSAGVLLSLPGISTNLPREKVCFPLIPILFPSPPKPILSPLLLSRLQANHMYSPAPPSTQSTNNLAKIRGQERDQGEDIRREEEPAVQRGDRGMGEEMGVQGGE